MTTRWPADVSEAIRIRDRGQCVGPVIGLSGRCYGTPQRDHIRASGGLGMKSPSTLENGALLCISHHRYKTEHGREVRPLLIAYVEARSAHRA